MHTFKTALTAFFRHPVYLVIYVVFLSVMGLFIGLSATPQESTDEFTTRPAAAVIDRDGGDVAKGLGSFIAANSDIVEIADTERAMQDALMQRQADYIVIIPEGFTDDFIASAREGAPAPTVQTVLGSQAAALYMMDNLVDEYLGIARLYAVALPGLDAAGVADGAGDAMALSADISVMRLDEEPPAANRFILYMKFASYTISISIAVCVAVVMSRFNRLEIRRRSNASPVKGLSANLQIAAACLVLALVCWAFVSALGLAAFGGDLAGAGFAPSASALLAMLCYALFGLAFGFFLGQLTSTELVMNAAANIVGLVMSFLGGAWIPLELVGEPVASIAHFVPSYYYCDALASAFGQAPSGSVGLPADLGMIALFAVALFAVALAIARVRGSDFLAARARARGAAAA